MIESDDKSEMECLFHFYQLKYWLSFIKAGHDPTEDVKPIIVIVGTHMDQLEDTELGQYSFTFC